MSSEPIACTLTSEELQQEAANLLPGLIATAQTVEWLPEGIRLIFSAETDLLQRIVSVNVLGSSERRRYPRFVQPLCWLLCAAERPSVSSQSKQHLLLVSEYKRYIFNS
jgi:hypothetical protein